ncbi:mitotic spindle assembly checkpoint protein MAD2 [Exophiala viscosa]|uniref:Mitotic spindle assembly checkpoint protein MAD2 n=1 Tax=Exophiala viscosa TaxID=2486360 RepID=A0AAN6IES5_9EURO|nr:mitotic spindle assembly checkpoint protein MAD2 [Exophiala viscosa]KAI1624236.1 mitotic spindle assembly checkpoint protein MAD2 [Exophiala viscosa]
MANPPPNASTISNLLSTHRALVETVTSFLTIATHHILYLRRLYPPVSFLSARAYNYPVRQNRHPQVCQWITDAIAAIRDQLEKNTVEKVSLCIYETTSNQVLERWTFDLRSFPTVAKKDRDIPFDTTTPAPVPAPAAAPEDQEDLLAKKLNLADLEANFRATLSRISTAATKLRPLPSDSDTPDAPECSFTLAIEVKDSADRPVGRLEKEERKWIAAEPVTFGDDGDDDNRNNQHGANAPKTHAVRRLEAGELRMEVWVEESAAKFEYGLPQSSELSAEARRARMSYGAGTERFDPGNEYDLEPPDINKRPQGGATDYQRDR